MHEEVIPVLYSFRRCPYAMRARMAIAAADCEIEHREILLSDRPEHLRAISATATVPCLEIRPGKVLVESLQIMSWALEQHDPLNWLPAQDQVKVADELIASNDGEFKYNLDRFKYPTRYDDADPLTARTNAERFVISLDEQLGRHTQLLGDKVSMADVAIFPFVRQFSRADEGWFASTPYEAVRRWLAWWETAPIFGRIMAKIPVWQPSDPVLRFTTAFPS